MKSVLKRITNEQQPREILRKYMYFCIWHIPSFVNKRSLIANPMADVVENRRTTTTYFRTLKSLSLPYGGNEISYC